mmetsp:Transcript_34497/g.31187  ORF Transcript_34497/g.31187 Transcript_34497/m.31187 type:complete len:89 (-) Transcript_34497:27-293(-)
MLGDVVKKKLTDIESKGKNPLRSVTGNLRSSSSIGKNNSGAGIQKSSSVKPGGAENKDAAHLRAGIQKATIRELEKEVNYELDSGWIE